MSKILEILKSLMVGDEESTRRAQEAYLAQAVDNYDLERRMRRIDLGERWD